MKSKIDSPASTHTGLYHLHPDAADYPAILRQYRYSKVLPVVSAIGKLEILQYKPLALFCSVKCPSNLILQTYNLTQSLHSAGITVISGFHSPTERECLTLLLHQTQPVIHCPARSLEGIGIATECKQAIAQNRLLLLSPFPVSQRRATTKLAQTRNSFVAALSAIVFIAYATPGSKTEALARQILAWGKPLLTLDSPDNRELINLGAKPVQPDSSKPNHDLADGLFKPQ